MKFSWAPKQFTHVVRSTDVRKSNDGQQLKKGCWSDGGYKFLRKSQKAL